MAEKKKSFKTLAENLRAVRRRPIKQEDVDRFNKIMDEEERLQREQEQKRSPDKRRKIARSPEADA